MKRTFRAYLFTCMVFLSITQPLAGAGQGEDPIRQARELISENRINEAILLLEQTVRENPERIQESEALMRTIREIRGEYNVLFEQLIDNLVNNPDDIERTLEIINSMEALDEFPNERVVEQVQDARIVAQLAFDRNLVEQRMDEARLLLDRGDYAGAVAVYFELRGLQRDRFDERGYGDIFVNSVNQAVTNLSIIAEEFTAALPQYQAAGNAVLAASGDDILLLDDEDLAPLFAEARRITDMAVRADEIARGIAVIKSQVPLQFPDDPIDWYLNFQDFIARGRNSHRGEEGIVSAVERAYRGTIGQLTDAARIRTADLFRIADEAVEAQRFDVAVESYRTAGSAAALWEQTEAALEGIFERDPTLETIRERLDPDRAHLIVRARTVASVARSLSAYSAIMGDAEEPSLGRTVELRALREQKDAVRGTVASLRIGGEEYELALEPIGTLPDAYRNETIDELLDWGRLRWADGLRRMTTRERRLAVAISTTRTRGFGEIAAAQETLLADLTPLTAGVEEEVPGEEGSVRRVRYPDRALEGYLAVSATLARLIDGQAGARDELTGDADYVVDSGEVRGEIARLDALTTRISELQGRTAAGAEEAQSLIDRAVALEEEATQRVADARTAIAAFQVAAARNNYDAAQEAFLTSLTLRENPQLRTAADTAIREIGLELQDLENVVVVRRVRELLTQAQNLYNQDEYIGARDTLIAAQQSWEQTNVEPNTEIDRLLRLVTAALSLEEGRELAATDPLFPILSSYLSIAREDFNEGVRLSEGGQNRRANAYFERAVENLRNVRAVRPLNWDARILELRIAQIQNTQDFDAVFTARYEAAVARLDQAGPLEVYSELEVLAEINPDFPGIQERIRQLEIALNLRPNPIDQARIGQAAELFRRANGLSGGSRDQVAVAVSLLEEAVDLNPNNNDAKFLLDQLRIQLGGQATIALSTTDEQQYRRAETLFSQGGVLQALAIVERLLERADNRSYPPLVELRRRIALRLGI